MTLDDLTYQVLEHIEPNREDDSSFSPRLIKDMIHTKRALFLRNELNKLRAVPENIQQQLGCLELEDADDAECCDFESGCTVKRTKLFIPDILHLHQQLALTRVGPVSLGAKPYSIVSYNDAIYFGNGRYNRNAIAAYYRQNRIYLVSKQDLSLIDFISIRGVFENPGDAQRFVACDGGTCYSDDLHNYPLDAWMWEYVRKDVIQDLMPVTQIPQDTENDNQDEADAEAGNPLQSRQRRRNGRQR